jgi:hypothetical protein
MQTVTIFLNAKYVVRKFAQVVQTMKKLALIIVSQMSDLLKRMVNK